MSWSLAIETSGARGGIALGFGEAIREVRSFESVGRHAADLMPSIAAACQVQGVSPKDISLVFVSQGPGSFTGLRLGVTVARMIGWGNGARIVGVPTLEAIAQNALDLPNPPANVAVMLDARRKNVYAAAFALKGERYVTQTEAIEVCPAQYLKDRALDVAVLGEGVRIHKAAIESAGARILPDEMHSARAEHVFKIGARLAAEGRFIDCRQITPTYVRLPEPEEKWAQRQAAC